tara:strand:+ start:1625 stop:2029 length:405 start_codon:yes stop_codon:yes gene_type:complete
MKSKRLTDNQRVLLSQLMKRYDDMLTQLIVKAKDTGAMNRPTEKLTQNSDFKRKLLSYHERFAETLVKKGLMLPIFEEAADLALVDANRIVAGQSRSDLRYNIDTYRCSLLGFMQMDYVNVTYQCDCTQNHSLI